MQASDYPILEFDPDRNAIIHPSAFLKRMDIPERCVFCFFQEVIGGLQTDGRLTHLCDIGSEIGKNPIYEISGLSQRMAIVHAGVGAPLSGAFLDEVIELGCRKFVAIGSAGVLNGDITLGHLIVPTSALRDEGTSYHYLPPTREVEPSIEAVEAIQRVLIRKDIPFITGKTWTTDAPYRETPAKIRRRREEGCVTVEMEAAAFFAIAKYREVQFGQILYGGDDVSGEVWDARGWHSRRDIRRGMLDLAIEALLEM